MPPIPIWIDCDPGHDDTVAILLALFNPAFKLVGVSTVYGNSSLDNTTRNALSILTAFDNKIPVYQGYDKPFVKPVHFAPDIHGESGLEGTELLPVPKYKAVNSKGDYKTFFDALNNAIDEYKGQISLVATGPLTNFGHFFQQYPETIDKIYRFSLMGGGLEVFNYGHSEFNIWCDPEGANAVLGNAKLNSKTIIAPLEATHKVICTQDIQKKILQGESKLRRLLFELMTFFADTYEKQQGFVHGPPLHDPLAVMVLLEEYADKSIDLGLKWHKLKIDVVEKGEKIGKFETTQDENGIKLVYDLDVEKFWDVLLETIDLADAKVQHF